MKESVGYTVTLNIIIVFISIIFAFIVLGLSYYKAYKVSNAITLSIEKFEGYNSLSQKEISSKLTSLGFNSHSITCKNDSSCTLVSPRVSNAGYCIYYCDDGEGYYHYRTITNMFWNIPIIGSVINIPVETHTEKIFDFEEVIR